MPPQCSGPEVVGWDWEAVDSEQAANGTTWGTFLVIGTWDGERLTLTELPAPPGEGGEGAQGGQVDTTSPCPEPAGGWAPLNRTATNQMTLDGAIAVANARPDIAGVWLDQSVNPASADPVANAALMNDPLKLVLNVRVAGDVHAAEREIRTIWGGALCVTPARHTRAELDAIRAELDGRREELGLLGVNLQEVNGTVEVGMVVEPAGLQTELDEAYGQDVVAIIPQLRVVSSGA
jgi:hypothetical protein